MKKLLVTLALAGTLSVPSVVFAEDMEEGAMWYGSLRGGLEFSDSRARFVDNFSRWGIRGQNEVSEGLTAVYNFEHNINMTNAGQPSGRLANIGLSGGFGNLSFGQIWSASDNHAGAILDNTQFYGSDALTGRVGSALSYAFSSDAISMQADVILDDGTNDPSKSVQEFQLGVTVGVGEFGRIALAYIDDKYSLDPGPDGLAGVERMLGQTGTVNSNPVPNLAEINAQLPTGTTLADLAANDNGVITALDTLLASTSATLIGTAQSAPAAVGEETATNRYRVGDWVVERTITAPAAAANVDGTDVDESAATNAYTWYDADSGQRLDTADDGVDDTTWSTKTTALAAQFSLSNVSLYVGVAKTKSNYEGHPYPGDTTLSAAQTAQAVNMESETTFFGLSGGLGDTGINYHFHLRDEDTAKPWVAGITKSLGGGASIQLEHANNDDDANPNATNLGLRVDF